MIYSESTAAEPDARHAWACAMSGVMPMMLKMDIAGTPIETLQQCRALQLFFESTDFTTMTSHDELAHAGTRWVLADPPRSYIAYSENLTSLMQVRGIAAGTYQLRWLDCQTGKTVDQRVTHRADETAFSKPQDIGNWSALSIHRVP